MLINRETSETTFTPTDLTAYINCAYLYTQRVARTRKEREWPKERTGNPDLVRRKGEEHELDYLERLKQQGLNVVEIESPPGWKDWTEAIEQTNAAINDPEVDVVFQAHLAKDGWRGKADFLERTGPDRTFEPVDTKLAHKVKPAYVLQLCFYADALADVQGRMPENFHVELGTHERKTLRLNDFIHYYRAARDRLVDYTHNGDHAAEYPWPVQHCSICDLGDECDQRRRDDDHLSLVAGIGRGQIEKLYALNVHTLSELAVAPDDSKPVGMAPATFDKLRTQAELQTHDEPGTWKVLEPEPGRGLSLLPAPDPGDVFYDIEGDPLFDSDGSLEYLHGLWWRDGDEDHFETIWSHDREQEKAGFEQLIDFFMERWRAHPAMHIYHYASYEEGVIKRLAQQYGTREEEVDDILRGGVLVDLYRVVRQSLQASVESYSIKKLEKFYMGPRTVGLQAGDDSIGMYEEFRETGEQALLDEIRDYNEDDCRSTFLLREWLLERRAEAAGEFGEEAVRFTGLLTDEDGAVAGPPEESRAALDRHVELAELAEEFSTLAAGDDSSVDTDTLSLAAGLMEYHRREAKPQQWAVFNRSDMTEEELIEDPEAIGGLVPLNGGEPVGQEKQSHIWELSFPPQDHRIRPGNKNLDAASRQLFGDIVEIDDEGHTLKIKRGRKRALLPLPAAIIPGWPLEQSSTEIALLEFGQSFLESARDGAEPEYPALHKLLLRDLPLDGTDIQALGEKSLPGLIEAVEGSYLVIQGPPGSGKTQKSAELILHLVQQGKRVGVTATSHKAIDGLLLRIEEVAVANDIEFEGAKKDSASAGSSSYESDVGMIESVRSNEAAASESYSVVGGTSWLFADEMMRGSLDYLFVDEAGQMALATALAAGTAANTLVLVGDPVQLPQVTQGAHPGNSAASAMEHALGEHATVPRDRGFFLANTWRLHPTICRFVSDTFYESRLESQPEAAGHSTPDGVGIRYLPVIAEGNRLESDEEARAIAEEVSRLVALGMDADRKRFIVVAPYNLQVDLINELLPAGVMAGTVDKFQGQEADVVLYSLTASSAGDVARGLDFLFSGNRFNVAISRGRALAYLVASPDLLAADCRSVEEMRLANRFCGFVANANELKENGSFN